MANGAWEGSLSPRTSTLFYSLFAIRYSPFATRFLIVRRGSAPARQINRIPAFRERQRFLDRLVEIGFHALARHFSAQEIRPQEFAERCRVLGETAGAPQIAGEAAERGILEARDRWRKILEWPAFALGVVRIDPPLIVHHAPECVGLAHGEIGDDA